ncbi:hypothetical protein CEXT_141471 [Caerostris extrusa]|uniref:Uncharacterized protein n=1 Tax=Caerostris extrusa TaxID=172846 RepID=A0AAV4R2D3_CAEEX|nr:hypothetical protein CEXT_141471 [Caerostris extrusa]
MFQNKRIQYLCLTTCGNTFRSQLRHDVVTSFIKNTQPANKSVEIKPKYNGSESKIGGDERCGTTLPLKMYTIGY